MAEWQDIGDGDLFFLDVGFGIQLVVQFEGPGAVSDESNPDNQWAGHLEFYEEQVADIPMMCLGSNKLDVLQGMMVDAYLEFTRQLHENAKELPR